MSAEPRLQSGESESPRGRILVGGILVASVVIGSLGLAAIQNADSVLGKALGAIVVLAMVLIVLLLATRKGKRDIRRGDRMVAVLAGRTREWDFQSGYHGSGILIFILDNELVLQVGRDVDIPVHFSAYFMGSGSPVSVRMSDFRRWDAGLGLLRRERRHLERQLDPSSRASLETLRAQVAAKAARLDRYLLREDLRHADPSLPEEMVRVWLDLRVWLGRDYDRLPERLLAAINPARSILDTAARTSRSGAPT